MPSGVLKCGALLFKLFTNDVGCALKSDNLLADDLKVFRVVRNPVLDLRTTSSSSARDGGK